MLLNMIKCHVIEHDEVSVKTVIIRIVVYPGSAMVIQHSDLFSGLYLLAAGTVIDCRN